MRELSGTRQSVADDIRLAWNPGRYNVELVDGHDVGQLAEQSLAGDIGSGAGVDAVDCAGVVEANPYQLASPRSAMTLSRLDDWEQLFKQNGMLPLLRRPASEIERTIEVVAPTKLTGCVGLHHQDRRWGVVEPDAGTTPVRVM